MSNGLIPINGELPSFMSGRRTSGSLNSARQGVASQFATIGIKGKVWSIKKGTEEDIIRDPATKRPVQHLDVVIVGVAQEISKTFYEGSYDGERNTPDCSSIDGIYPDAGVPHKQNATCQGCPQNRFGSRTGRSGKPAKACSDHRRIAIVPLGDIYNQNDGGPMLLRIPLMSLANFRKYASELERRGASDIWWVGTRLEFDAEFEYQRITFNVLGWVTEEQDQQIQSLREDGLVDELLSRAGPTESSDTIDSAPIPGTPPARAAQSATVTSLPPRRIEPAPRRVEPAPIEDESEVEAAPALPAQAPAATRPQGRTSPFQAQQARTPSRPAARAAAQEAPTAAPMDLESAIDDLFSSTGKSA